MDDTFAQPAGLTQQQVIYTDDPNQPELIQYISSPRGPRTRTRTIRRCLRLTEIYHDPEVEAAIQAEAGYQGSFKNNPPAELQTAATELEIRFRK